MNGLILAADTGGNYVAAAYAVFFVVLLVYLAIMAGRLSKIQFTLSRIMRKLDGDE
jgi:hypothetical protein